MLRLVKGDTQMINGLLMLLIFLLCWLPSLIVGFEAAAYNILWLFIYFFMTLGIFKIFQKHKTNRQYICLLLLNYLYHHSFRIFFVYYNNYFYAFTILLINILISGFWYYETRKIDKATSYYLLPYLFGVLSLILLFIYR